MQTRKVVENEEFKQILKKYLDGELNEIDSYLVEEWYNSFDEPKDIHSIQEDADRLAVIGNNLQQTLNDHIIQEKKVRKINFWPIGIAASFLLCALFAWLFYQSGDYKKQQASGYRIVKTGIGELKKLKFPDGTEIWVNACSTIRYNLATYNSERTIYLDKGEAFFNVTHDPKHPFVVKSSNIFTHVLGTSFDVKNYKELNYSSVAVKSGKVAAKSNVNNQLVVLTANQEAVYNNSSKQFTSGSKSDGEIGDWINGDIFLQEATFSELSLMFHNKFGIDLSSSDPKILGYHYTINIINGTPILSTINLICSIHQNKYRRAKNDIVIY